MPTTLTDNYDIPTFLYSSMVVSIYISMVESGIARMIPVSIVPSGRWWLVMEDRLMVDRLSIITISVHFTADYQTDHATYRSSNNYSIDGTVLSLCLGPEKPNEY
jgi:hypothetical protein